MTPTPAQTIEQAVRKEVRHDRDSEEQRVPVVCDVDDFEHGLRMLDLRRGK